MFKLPDLPYDYDALDPAMSDRTLHFHHDKHHATYVKTLNEILEKAGQNPDTLEEVVRQAARSGEKKLFNNAAQAWNHAFFWTAMTPKAERPNGELGPAIEQAFGGVAALAQTFVKEGAGHFGSGWVWLVSGADGRLSVRATHDADDTIPHGELTPLLVCDLWEHAYYLDYQNDRKTYLESWFEALPNWSFAADQYEAARGRRDAWTFAEA